MDEKSPIELTIKKLSEVSHQPVWCFRTNRVIRINEEPARAKWPGNPHDFWGARTELHIVVDHLEFRYWPLWAKLISVTSAVLIALFVVSTTVFGFHWLWSVLYR